jgi:arylsulfatase A-like enzyme
VRPSRAGGAALLAAWLGALACAPRASRRVEDLAAQFAYAERRSEQLDLGFLLAEETLVHEGWVREGEAGVLWSRHREATLELPFQSSGPKQLRLRARSHPALGASVRARVTLDGTELGVLDLAPEEHEFRLAVPATPSRPDRSRLRFELPDVARLGQGHRSRRPRGFALLALETQPLGPALPAPRVPLRQDGRILLPPASSLCFYLRGAAGTQLQLRARAGTRPGQLAVWLDLGQGPAPLAHADLQPERTADLRVAVAAPAGTFYRLELANPGRTAAWLDSVRLRVEEAPPPPSTALPARPNIVVFLTDALRADVLGAYGHSRPTSPRFDAFAREAVVFEDAVSQSSWTRPAVASLLTGMGPDAHGAGDLDQGLPQELTTLAEALKAGGYRTAAFVSNHVVGKRFGFDQGFDLWNSRDDRSALFGRSADEVVGAALRWAVSAQEPFFIYIHTLEPHGPYNPGDEHWAPFRAADYRGEQNPTVLAQRRALTPGELGHLRSAYEGEVHQNDAAFGRFLDGLRTARRLDTSLLLFTADHGEEFRDHGGGGHGHSLYQEVVRVPLAVRFPGGQRGGWRETAPVQHVDLTPTLLALAGLRPLEGLQGRDLSALWLGRGTAGPEPLLFNRLSFDGADALSVRSGRMKLLLSRNADDPGRPRLELYDLARDPAERTNLLASQVFAARYLQQRARALESAQRQQHARLGPGQKVALTPEDREQLRALGYLQ